MKIIVVDTYQKLNHILKDLWTLNMIGNLKRRDDGYSFLVNKKFYGSIVETLTSEIVSMGYLVETVDDGEYVHFDVDCTDEVDDEEYVRILFTGCEICLIK